MRVALFVLLVLIGVLLWRALRPPRQDPLTPAPPPATEPVDMVRCTLCAIHVPSAEAVQGLKGLYCCAEHRHHAEP